jgi:mono/diheme cytochrome c family protein
VQSDPTPSPLLTRLQSQSVPAYLRRIRAGAVPPQVSDEALVAVNTFATSCAGCHKISGEGGENGPDLSDVGGRLDAAALKRIILEPTSEYPDTLMPSFAERLSERQLNALVQYLANRH